MDRVSKGSSSQEAARKQERNDLTLSNNSTQQSCKIWRWNVGWPDCIFSLPSRLFSDSRGPATTRLEVKLHIYDCFPAFNWMFEAVGAFHTGVELCGKEWAFGYTSTASGVYDTLPQRNGDYAFRETIMLGTTELTEGQVAKILEDLAHEYAGTSYNLVHRNCNHFASDLCTRLGVELPSFINRLAWIASFGMWWVSLEWRSCSCQNAWLVGLYRQAGTSSRGIGFHFGAET